jgi:hypothetical protein
MLHRIHPPEVIAASQKEPSFLVTAQHPFSKGIPSHRTVGNRAMEQLSTAPKACY